MQRLTGAGFILQVMASVLFLTGCGPGSEPVVLTIAGGAVGRELDLTVGGTQRFMEENPDIRVDVTPIPDSSSDRLTLYQSLFNKSSPEVDVFQIDVVWLGMVAPHAVDLRPLIAQADIERHFPSLIENNLVEGKLVGLPWFVDAPSLYYRSDLLEKYGFENPPATWEELEAMSRKISEGERQEGNLGFWGFVWQGAPYEGLTCNALEWQFSHGGGNFLDSQGRPNLNTEATRLAFQRATEWVGTITPPDVLEFAEDESRLLWEKGHAAFLRNWSYVYSLASEAEVTKGKFDIVPLPAGAGGRAATLGGWQLMVSKYSAHPEEAARLIQFLASKEEQKIRAIEGSLNPTIASLYHDPEVLDAVPFFAGFDKIMNNLVIRPAVQAGEKYGELSMIYWTAVHDILSKKAEAAERLAQAEKEMNEVLGH